VHAVEIPLGLIEVIEGEFLARDRRNVYERLGGLFEGVGITIDAGPFRRELQREAALFGFDRALIYGGFGGGGAVASTVLVDVGKGA
jgi:hypothetical protein